MPITALPSRYALAWPLFLMAIATFAITRTLLTFMSADMTELDLLPLLRIYGVGLAYDLLFFLYALLPISLYFLLLPNRLWHSTINRTLVHLACFGAIYGLLFIVVAEYLFWQEFHVRFNFISVDYLVYRHEVVNNIMESYPVTTILAGLLVISCVLYWWITPLINRALRHQEPFKRRLVATLTVWLVPALAFATVTPNMNQTSTNIYQNELSSNGPYQFFAAFRNNELDYNQFYASLDEAHASTLLRELVSERGATFNTSAIFDIKRTIQSRGGDPKKKLNVVLVMVESLSANFLGAFGDRRGLTPHLDRLAEQSLLFTHFYATGTRTVRGLEAVTLSIPPTPGNSIVKRLGRESNLWSLGNVLKSKGYDTQFIYGGRGYFDNMNAFFSGNGYGVIDQASTPTAEIGFENAWGMADESIYSQTLKAADSAYLSGKPFFFHIMTTSNHRPFTYPTNRIDIAPGSREGAVKYTDWAIGDLIERAKSKPWFNDTLFVFVADHTAGSAGKTALPLAAYHIPLLIYS
ncbi:MAG: sulfatase, partial [Halothiobacillaceae bacterium]